MIKFHPIHFTVIVTVIITLGALFLAHHMREPMVFIAACLVLPNVMSIGRFEDNDDNEVEDDNDHSYKDEPRAGFLANVTPSQKKS